jgi:hypothetical protein
VIASLQEHLLQQCVTGAAVVLSREFTPKVASASVCGLQVLNGNRARCKYAAVTIKRTILYSKINNQLLGRNDQSKENGGQISKHHRHICCQFQLEVLGLKLSESCVVERIYYLKYEYRCCDHHRYIKTSCCDTKLRSKAPDGQGSAEGQREVLCLHKGCDRCK